MEDLALIYFTSLALALTGVIMPGPLLALTLKESLSRGKWAAMWLSSGHSLCELFVVGALAGGLTQIVSPDSLAGPIGLVGGGILFWMGVGAFRQARVSQAPIAGADSPANPRHMLMGGVLVTIANPYWLVWWLTAGLALLLFACKAGLAGIAAFYIGHISADFLWLGLVGFLVARRRASLNATFYRRIIQGCAVFLLVFGALFVGYGTKMIHGILVH